MTAHTCIIHTNVTETCGGGSRAPRRDETRCAGAVRSRWFARSHRFRVRVTWLMAGPRRTRAAASSPANLNPYASSESPRSERLSHLSRTRTQCNNTASVIIRSVRASRSAVLCIIRIILYCVLYYIMYCPTLVVALPGPDF